MYPLVSVVIPSYNHASYITAAIESVLRQSYSNLELIIIDDGSTDDSLRVIDGIPSEKIKLIVQQNQGAHAAINRGIAESSGDYVTILNSDDIYYPDRLRRLVEHTSGNKNVLVFSDIRMIDELGREYNSTRWESYQKLHSESLLCGENDLFLLGNIAYTTSNFFIGRKLLDRVGEFKPLRYTHDWNWALRSILCEKVEWLHEDLLYYRVHSTNTLNETDFWFSVIEDSYNFSCYLYALIVKGMEAERVLELYLRKLAKNDSYLPFFVGIYLSFLLAGSADNEDDLLRLITSNDFGVNFKDSVQSLSYHPTVFHSLTRMNDFVSAYDKQTEMIDERDTYIADLIKLHSKEIKQWQIRYNNTTAQLHATLEYKCKRLVKALLSRLNLL